MTQNELSFEKIKLNKKSVSLRIEVHVFQLSPLNFYFAWYVLKFSSTVPPNDEDVLIRRL